MDFSKIDTFIKEDIHKEIYQTYARGTKSNIDVEDVPFRNHLDLWMLGFCIAIKKDLKPISKDYKGVRAIQGQVFVENQIIESIIKLILIDKSKNEEILLNPNKIHAEANDLSLAGINYVKDFINRV